MQTIETIKRICAGMSATAFLLASTAMASAADVDVIWNKGFFEEEDNAFLAFVEKWEAKTGHDVEVTFVPVAEVIPKVVAAMEAGDPPDVAFGHLFDWQTTPRWAFEGALADVSGIVDTMKGDFLPGIEASIRMVNGVTGASGFYVVPIEQQTTHVHYWSDIMEEAGLSPEDIPQEWDAFWNFFCNDFQTAARNAGHRVFGHGQVFASASSDSNFHINMYLSAHGAELVDSDGNFVGDTDQNRAATIAAFESYTTGAKDCVPSGSVSWGDGDNNTDFLNRNSLMTANPTLSIPASQAGTENYDLIKTIPWPAKGPGGESYPVMTSVKHAVVFAEAENADLGKQFLADLIKPENLQPYVEGSRGRWQPVISSIFEVPFWTDPSDSHRNGAHLQYTTTETKPFAQIYNQRYTQVQAENLLARAASRIVLDGVSAEEAVDEMNARIAEILAE